MRVYNFCDTNQSPEETIRDTVVPGQRVNGREVPVLLMATQLCHGFDMVVSPFQKVTWQVERPPTRGKQTVGFINNRP